MLINHNNYQLMKEALITFKTFDRRFILVLEKGSGFTVNRLFYFRSPANEERGFHAHKKLKQVMFCLQGSVEIELFKICLTVLKRTIREESMRKFTHDCSVWLTYTKKYAADQIIIRYTLSP